MVADFRNPFGERAEILYEWGSARDSAGGLLMRWICKTCHRPTVSSWCDHCHRNTGVFTDADLGPIVDAHKEKPFSQEHEEWLVGKILEAYGGRDPKGE